MTAQVQAVLEQAKRLTPEERDELIEGLHALDDGDALPLEEVQRQWAPEIERRRKRMQSGADPGEPADDVLDAIEAEAAPGSAP